MIIHPKALIGRLVVDFDAKQRRVRREFTSEFIAQLLVEEQFVEASAHGIAFGQMGQSPIQALGG